MAAAAGVQQQRFRAVQQEQDLCRCHQQKQQRRQRLLEEQEQPLAGYWLIQICCNRMAIG